MRPEGPLWKQYKRTGICPCCGATEGEYHRQTCDIRFESPRWNEALDRGELEFLPGWVEDPLDWCHWATGHAGRPAADLAEYLTASYPRKRVR